MPNGPIAVFSCCICDVLAIDDLAIFSWLAVTNVVACKAEFWNSCEIVVSKLAGAAKNRASLDLFNTFRVGSCVWHFLNGPGLSVLKFRGRSSGQVCSSSKDPVSGGSVLEVLAWEQHELSIIKMMFTVSCWRLCAGAASKRKTVASFWQLGRCRRILRPVVRSRRVCNPIMCYRRELYVTVVGLAWLPVNVWQKKMKLISENLNICFRWNSLISGKSFAGKRNSIIAASASSSSD